jgi:hypothetical protein
MSILLSMLLAQARVLPEIDRRALELQSRAESLQGHPSPARRATAIPAPARRAPQQAAVQPRKPTQTTAPVTRAAARMQRPANLRRAAGGALDLGAITTICRAAGNQADPATFISTLSRAYTLSSTETSSLRTSCAAYLAGRADARVNSYESAPR